MTESDLIRIVDSVTHYVIKESVGYSKQIRDDIRRVIKEEHGISQEVENAFMLCQNALIRDFNKQQWKCDSNGTYYKEGNINLQLFGNDIELPYTIYNFINEENALELEDVYDLNCYFDHTKMSIIVKAYIVNGSLDIQSFDDSLQHEISHLFDFSKRGHLPIQDNYTLIYKRAIELTQNENDTVREIGEAVYASFPSEQIGLVNGLDAQLRRNNNANSPFNVLYNTDAYYYLNTLLKMRDSIANYPIVINRVFNMSVDKMTDFLNSGYESFYRKASRVMWKYIEPYEATHPQPITKKRKRSLFKTENEQL